MKNRLDKLLARREKLVIPVEKSLADEVISFDLQGLTFPDLTKFSKLAENKSEEEAINFLLFTSLRKNFPKEGDDAVSDEEIINLCSEMNGVVAGEIIKKVMELSGMKVPEPKKGLGAEKV